MNKKLNDLKGKIKKYHQNGGMELIAWGALENFVEILNNIETVKVKLYYQDKNSFCYSFERDLNSYEFINLLLFIIKNFDYHFFVNGENLEVYIEK